MDYIRNYGGSARSKEGSGTSNTQRDPASRFLTDNNPMSLPDFTLRGSLMLLFLSEWAPKPLRKDAAAAGLYPNIRVEYRN